MLVVSSTKTSCSSRATQINQNTGVNRIRFTSLSAPGEESLKKEKKFLEQVVPNLQLVTNKDKLLDQ